MKTQNELIVISLTHWDREWRFPFQKTRMLLTEMMDGVLDLLDKDEDYKCFHLDGQTILLEDYCLVRPENKERIKKYVEDGRLVIGPWFCLPDVNQLMGESLSRNFLWGERLGREFGGNMKVGYAPASWGQVSQMPQIMQNFGIDSVMFYRGISADQVPGNYYMWEGADGSKLFGVRLGDWARASFFHLVDRPVVHDRGRGDQSHEWSRGGKPFHMTGTGSTSVYEFYRPPMGWHPERVEEAIRELEELDLGKWETSFAPAMECDDSTGPFPATPRIIKEANKLIQDDRLLTHGSLPEFISRAMEILDKDKLPLMQGEMRYPQRAGVWTDLLPGIQANRTPLKYAHRQAEFLVQRTAEPMATLAWLMGEEYPAFFLDQCWHWLLENQAHDSIGACGVDAVADDVMERFRQVQIVGNSLTAAACREIAGRIDTSGLGPEEILVIVFNSLPVKRSGVVAVEADTESERGIQGFTVEDLQGTESPVQINTSYDTLVTFNHPHELPLRTPCKRWEFEFEAEDVPAMGYKVYRFVPSAGTIQHPGTLRTGEHTMENEYLSVTVNPNGTFDLLDKEQNITYSGLGYFEDTGAAGDHWTPLSPQHDRVILSAGCAADICVDEEGPLAVSFKSKLTMQIPAGLNADRTARLEETRPVDITLITRLVKGENFLRLKVTVNNTAECHTLRIMFPTLIDTDKVQVEMPYDIVTRDIQMPKCRDWREPYYPRQVQQNMVDLTDGKRGFAVLNQGLTQYEAVDNQERVLAITLIRAITNWNAARLAFYPDQPGTQLQGEYTFDLAVMPHKGDWQEGECLQAVQAFNVPMITGAAGAGAGDQPVEQSLCELNGEGLVLNCLKKGEWDNSLIARISNSTDSMIKGSLVLFREVSEAEAVNMMETETIETLASDRQTVSFSIGPKKVITVRMTLK
ncbi:alpha-mannosidase [Planctomycetota bacterium]